jgi:hypothetical protein|tara:strand:+ start:4115 stop:4678 length:564 start_codon:yes stop_codon:yes gene_type:complete
MRISHKHKFVFISVPKTGSTSVRSIIDPYSDILSVNNRNSPYKHHTTALNLKKHFKSKGWDWNSYFKFSVARNPWDRRVSSWAYRLKKGEHNYNEFKDFVTCRPSTPQTNWLFNESGNSLMDYIFKLEDPNGMNKVFERLSIPKVKLPHKNRNGHKHYTEYYDDETRQIVAEKYAKDIEYFNYEFGE